MQNRAHSRIYPISQKVVSFVKAAAEAETFKSCCMLRVHAPGTKGATLSQLKRCENKTRERKGGSNVT